MKTHAIEATEILSWSPRAFQKISDSNAQWFPLAEQIVEPAIGEFQFSFDLANVLFGESAGSAAVAPAVKEN